ncbi:MAG: PilZ domain-containing protein [Zymomonas sp.]|nr:MAG: PilZ domain-containing protein [Zymomonas sp.]
MDVAAVDLSDGSRDAVPTTADQRGAPRFTSLIRAAKLVSTQGEFVCVMRDVSTSGVRLRCFHAFPNEQSMALELPNGELFEVERVRDEGLEASFRFVDDAPIERLLAECRKFPRRQLRLNIAIPLTLRTLAGPISAFTQNISQQGCRIECATPLALSQSLVIESDHLPGIRAKVRWRRDGDCGLVFDDTFTLRDFALHAARLQCPALAET